MHSHDDEAESCGAGPCGHDHAPVTRTGIWLAIAAVLSLLVAYSYSVFGADRSGYAGSIPTALYWVAFVSGGLFATLDALRSLARGRLTIDVLMVAAGLGAAWIGHLPEGALLLTLFSIGHAAEHHAVARADKSIRALTAMRPTTATRLDPVTRQTTEVAIDSVRVGDTVVVKPDRRIPVDGVVIAGQSSVDQSAITGESIPVDKNPLADFDAVRDDAALVAKDQQVFAGTVNGYGSLEIQVTRKNSDSTLARVARLIAEAKTQRSPTQRLTEAFEKRYVPAVLVLVAIILFAFVVIDEPFSRSLYRAMAVLVAASPCALAIATPSAVLSAIARAGRKGVLVKGGGPLEQLGRVAAVAFDKTGTLTTGRPEVAEIITMPGVSRRELLAVACAVQRLSDHPLARAIVRAAETELSADAFTADSLAVSDIRRVAGQGVTARLADRLIAIGNAKLFESAANSTGSLSQRLIAAAEPLQANGSTITFVQSDDRPLGVIALIDTLRPSARQAVASLRQLGLQPLVMLSGDHARAAQAIGERLELDEVRGDLSPEDKVDWVANLNQARVTAMVGDGANDAPAMAAASVSVAMGAAGSDVALETADVALMGDDLVKLPFALELGRASSRVIRQNLWISLGMIAFLVPAALAGLELGAAVILHEGSTVLVVANALRLLAFRSTAGNEKTPPHGIATGR
ncbi:MAG: heavy metal translocating P-type ATPase [Planctomycetaceae bacterium]